MTLYDQYIDGVNNGSIVTGELVKLAIRRHLTDLTRQGREDFPFVFDRAKADRVIKFMSYLRLTGGSYRGKKWELMPFQAFYFASVYGWVHKDTGFRRFRTVYWCTARKSAKSEKTAGEEIYHLIGDGEGSPQIVNVATTRDQAAFVYDAAHYMATMIKTDSASIDKIVKLRQYEITNTDNGGYITCLTADHKKNDGGNIQFGAIDEYHAHDNDSMVKVVETGMGMRDQPLLKICTTAGFNKDGPDYKFRDICSKILRGQIVNESIFAMIYEMDEGDDWHDEANWYKPNPLLGITPKLDFMRDQYNKAITEGGETMVQFQTKNLNMYTDAASVWVSDEHYMKLANRKSLEALRGKFCFLGVDLASIQDLTAVSAFFPAQVGLEKDYYATQYFCPESKFSKVRVDGVEYNEFLKDGWVRKTEGNVIDKIGILNHASDILTNSDLIILGYDPYKAVDIVLELQELGIECVQVRQGIPSLGQAVDYWEKQMFNEQIEHDGSPVTRWQIGNVEFARDNNNNKKIVKSDGKNSKKVDGPVSIEIAIAVYLEWKKDNDKGMGEDEMTEFLKATGQI